MASKLSNTAEASSPVAETSYSVLSPVFHGTTSDDQRRYEIGDTMVLADGYAAPLLACGAIVAEAAPPP